jgi:hypothetical protein
MKTFALAALVTASVLIGAPAVAQQASPPPAAAAAAAAAAKLSVESTPISTIIKNAEAKAALENAVPQIADYYDQIGEMTLAEVAPMSEGVITAATLRTIQAEFDKIR